MTIQEARALKPGEMASDRDYYRTSTGLLVENAHTHHYGMCRTCALKKDEEGIFCYGHAIPGGCGSCGPETWLKVPAYQTKPSKEWSFEDWKEAAEAGAYVEGTYAGVNAEGTLSLIRASIAGVYVGLTTNKAWSVGYTNGTNEAYDVPARRPDGTYLWNITGDMSSKRSFSCGYATRSSDFIVIDKPKPAASEAPEAPSMSFTDFMAAYVIDFTKLSNPGASVSGTGVSQTKPGEGTSPTQERDINMSNLTKSEKAAASNSNVQAFAALSYGVQAILRKAFEQDPSALQYLNEDGQWKRCTNATFGANKIYRVNPDAQTAPEQRELALRANGSGDYVVQGYSAFAGMGLFAIAANKNTIGIVYEKYGSRNVQKSLSLDFGTPVAVIVKG